MRFLDWNTFVPEFTLGSLMSLLEDSPRRMRRVNFPLLNMWGKEDELVVSAELPGVNPNDLEINVRENLLAIQGKREDVVSGENIQYHRQERPQGQFNRTLKLPFVVDPEKVEAKYEKGILSIKLPRAEKDKPRKIQVQAG